MAKVALGTALDSLSGKAGTAVFAETPQGTVLRPRTTPHDPQTPAQLERRNLFRRAMAFFHQLTPDQYAQWQTYADKALHRDPLTGQRTHPAAHNLYLSLTQSFLALHPHDTPPTLPPAQPFDGDTLTLTVTAGEGTLTFTADMPNAPDVTTELLLQPLVSAFRTPLKRGYRHQAYHTFTPDALTVTLPCETGWCAPAIRFLQTSTGQTAQFQFLGKVEIPAP